VERLDEEERLSWDAKSYPCLAAFEVDALLKRHLPQLSERSAVILEFERIQLLVGLDDIQDEGFFLLILDVDLRH
jgi:hypothetical protein